jgi:hypothetical protein
MIKTCSFCTVLLCEEVEPALIKLKLKKIFKNKEKYETNITKISRCAKCKKVYGCAQCSTNVEKHYKECRELEVREFIFNNNTSNKPEFNFTVLPKELGGGVVNVKHVNYLDEFIVYKFHETNIILIYIKSYDGNIITAWTNDEQFYIQHNLKKSIGENMCFKIMNAVIEFNEMPTGYYKFNKIRPNWLRCSYSNSPLELDMYNEELKIAVEFNGEQHYKFVPWFHQKEDNFIKQQIRDTEKIDKCREIGVNLIIVPFTCTNFKDVETCIREQLFLFTCKLEN